MNLLFNEDKFYFCLFIFSFIDPLIATFFKSFVEMFLLLMIMSDFEIFLVLSMKFEDFHFQFHHSIQNRQDQFALVF